MSDHLPCYTAIEKKVKSIGIPKYITIQQQDTDTIPNLIDDLKHIDIYNKLSYDYSPNIEYNHFASILIAKTKQHIPEKTVRFNTYKHKKELWMTTGILNSIRYRDKIFSRSQLLKPASSRYSNSKCNLDSYNKIVEKIHKNSKKDILLKDFWPVQTW